MRTIIRPYSPPIPQIRLHVVVIAGKIEQQRVALARKQQPDMPATAALENFALQSPDPGAAAQMRPAPTGRRGLHGREHFIAIQPQLSQTIAKPIRGLN